MSAVERMVGCSVAAALMCAAASAGTLINDKFDDGARNGARTDTTTGQWYYDGGSAPLPVVQNDPSNSSKALYLNQSGRCILGFTTTNYGAGTAANTLTNVGDKMVLTFNLRFVNTPGVSDTSFRFGMYNSQGTRQTGDSYGAVTDSPVGFKGRADDVGFFWSANFTTAANGGISLNSETTNTDGTYMGNVTNWLAQSTGTILGTSQNTITTTVTKTAAGADVSYDLNGTVWTASVAAASVPTYAFDTVAIYPRVFSSPVYVDNVNLAMVPVPEPASLGALAVAACGLLYRRRA